MQKEKRWRCCTNCVFSLAAIMRHGTNCTFADFSDASIGILRCHLPVAAVQTTASAHAHASHNILPVQKSVASPRSTTAEKMHRFFPYLNAVALLQTIAIYFSAYICSMVVLYTLLTIVAGIKFTETCLAVTERHLNCVAGR